MDKRSQQSPYVKLLLSSRRRDHKSDAQALYQWGMADHELAAGRAQQGNEEQLLSWLEKQSQDITLILPGEDIVVRRVDYQESEKRHFAKMLPYELEDDIVDDVEQCHFATGIKDAGKATVAYINETVFESARQVIVDAGNHINRCFADFQLIATQPQALSIWFVDERVLVHSVSGEGFSCDTAMAPVLLSSFLQEIDEGISLAIYAQAAAGSEQANSIANMMNTIAPDREHNFHYQSPELSCSHKQAINFCIGPYAKSISQSQWIKEFKGVAILGLVAFVAFVGVNSFDIYRLQEKNQQLRQQIEQSYRTVIPRGVVNDPVRQLRRKLSKASNTVNEPSQAVYLLSIVAPLINQLDIDLSAVNYSNKDRQMGLNIQADSFNAVEKLRTEINNKGLNAELLSSNAIDNKYQARLRVSLR